MENEIQTEECCVPKPIPTSGVEVEHLERYKFSCNYVKSKRVLDIACGAGYGSHMIKLAGASYVLGGDISANNVQYCNAHFQMKDLEFKQLDICQPIVEKPFDVIISFETIEHISNYTAALKNLHKILAKNGLLIVSSPNRTITEPYLKQDEKTSSGHEREFTASELRTALKKAGFEEIGYYVQLMQICFNTPFTEKHFKRLFKPHKWANPRVRKVERLIPQYMIMVARKNEFDEIKGIKNKLA